MKTEYGSIKITVKAEEDAINDDEIELFNAFDDLLEKLEDWLTERKHDHGCFEFEIEEA